MSYLVDSHCHLHDPEWFTPDQQQDFLKNAEQDGVRELICIGTNPEDSLTAHDFASGHDGVYWTYGIHPEFAGKFTPGDKVVPDDKLVAIGEIGLDYHYDGYDRTAQIRLFEQMLQLSLDLGLPVSLHIREAFDDAWAVLDNFSEVRGVVHSFTGSKKCLKKALDRGFYIGVNGLSTYTTNPLPPLENMVLETDAPFLTPVPFRGTMNQPRYIRTIAEYLAGEMGVAEELIAEQTTKNARELFHLWGADPESTVRV